ncbi:MAG: FtsX-like permease family protein, partial [Rhodothermales bacterium]
GVWLTLSLVGGTLAVGLLAGLYPAMYLSRFRPATMLRNAAGAGGGSFRRGLVVGQFAISIALIAGTFVVVRQLDYLETKDLGFDPEQVVVLPTGDTSIRTRFDAFKQAVLSHPSVVDAAGSSAIPGQGTMAFGIVPEGISQDQTWTAWSLRVDDDNLLDTYGVDLVSGRYFSDDLVCDSSAIVINKSLVDALGWTDPVGKRLDVVGEVNGGVVVGVVEDFHYESLYHAIDPLVLFLSPRGQNLSVRVNDVADALSHLEKTWKAFEPRYPFEYYFVDESFAAQYEAERRLSTTIAIFAALAVLIACLGLLGLASFTAEQRRKEIGVRKVLGATAAQIVLLLSQDFIRLVAIAFVIGAPLAFIAMTRWLGAFAYKVPVGPGVFIIAGLAAAIVALAAIGSQSARAAFANPTRSLRNE